MDTPSELLTRAADLIRDAAAEASQREWIASHETVEAVPELYHRTPVVQAESAGDARWIALLNPSVAGPIEAWLRYEAKQIEGLRSPRAGIALPETRHATAFARAVLGLVDTPEEAK